MDRCFNAAPKRIAPMYALCAQLLEPYTLLVMSLGVALVWAWWSMRPHRRAIGVAGALLGTLAILSTPIFSDLLMESLEGGYPKADATPAAEDTIVVLGGNLRREGEDGGRLVLGSSSAERCLYAAELYRRSGRCRVVVAGGAIDSSLPDQALATVMRDFLVEIGVRAEDVALEDRSTTTFENARNVKPLLERAGDGRVWLVTEAIHMRRSERCFLAQGIRVTPAPCDDHTFPSSFSLVRLLPTSRGIVRVDQAAHEWTGLFWYWLKGRI